MIIFRDRVIYRIKEWQKSQAFLILSHTLDCWKRDQITIRAAALTYTTILSLVPAIAICIYLFARVAEYGRIPTVISSFLLKHLPEPLSGWVARFTDFSSMPDLFKKFVLENLASGTGGSVLDHLDSFISKVNFGAIGLVGSLSVLVTSVLLLFSIENSMNVIWRAPRNKTLLRRFTIYTLALIFAPLLLFTSFSLSTIVASLFPDFLMTAKLGSFISTAILLIASLKFFPNTKVNWKPAIISGALMAIGIELLKIFFAYYTRKSMLYSAVYGSLSALPFFLVWVYLNWIVFLCGTLLNYVMQNAQFLARLGDHTQWDMSAVYHRDRARLILEISQSLKNGPMLLQAIVNEVSMPEFAVAHALEWMRQHKWVKEERRGLTRFLVLTDKARSRTDAEGWSEILGVDQQELARAFSPTNRGPS
jgi:YihY family inner membrane protein